MNEHTLFMNLKGIKSTHSWVRAKNSRNTGDYLLHAFQYFFLKQVIKASHMRKNPKTIKETK